MPDIIVEFGHFALCLALVVAVLQCVVPLAGLRNDSLSALRFADAGALVQFLATAVAMAALTYAYVVSDFSVATVALNSHSAKPMLYKVTGVWANHEGSMLLWVLMLALFGALISVFGRSVPTPMRATVLAVQAAVGVGFLAYILFTSNPFERLALPPLDGQGMNPLLQDPGVAFHPPMLYLGYVGFSTAFSFAVAALIRGRVDPAWARWMRPWVLVAWAGLTLGIALGSWWAYYELGWGGFWFWDPVENASFMPWLLATALLHSAIVVEKREALQKWTILLAILTFALSLIGTFLVRSGILSSVHSFATDPERGVFILGLLALFIGGALALFAWRAPMLKDGGYFAPVSREGALLLNNVLLAAAAGVVFIGTLYPLFLELMTGEKITVGAPYFNQTFLPIFGVTAAVAAVGPFLSWKRADLKGVLQRLRFAFVAALIAAVLLAMTGWREPLGLLGLALAAWLASATVADLLARIGLPKVGAVVALRRLVGLPTSAWGLVLGHLGLAVAVAGVAAISVWQSESIQVQQPGDVQQVAGYEFSLMDVGAGRGANYQTSIATVKVTRDGETVALLFPERRWYPVERQPTTEAGIVTLWHGDLYAVLGDPDGAGGWVTRYYYNPGVAWMWAGALLMALGALVSVSDRRLRVGVPRRALRPAVTAVLALMLVAGAVPALAIEPGEMFDDPAKEARAQTIGKQLRCLVCQNQSIFDSNAELAGDLRAVVRERIRAGDDDQAVLDYVVARYGDYVLLRPPFKTHTLVLWGAPLVLLLLAAVAARSYTRRRRQPGGLTAEERAEARALLRGDAS
ncbi:MAG TPA: heme lyase CcmF/NrfE family subunit [Kiloniellaceae bacterium]|nr:heme lyase CcmF/NrfE family subunit [Kiloniellaceae bacterium]